MLGGDAGLDVTAPGGGQHDEQGDGDVAGDDAGVRRPLAHVVDDVDRGVIGRVDVGHEGGDEPADAGGDPDQGPAAALGRVETVGGEAGGLGVNGAHGSSSFGWGVPGFGHDEIVCGDMSRARGTPAPIARESRGGAVRGRLTRERMSACCMRVRADDRVLSGLAAGLAALSVACCVAAAVLHPRLLDSLDVPPLSWSDLVLGTIYPVAGAVIVRSRPRNAVGWVLVIGSAHRPVPAGRHGRWLVRDRAPGPPSAHRCRALVRGLGLRAVLLRPAAGAAAVPGRTSRDAAVATSRHRAARHRNRRHLDSDVHRDRAGHRPAGVEPGRSARAADPVRHVVRVVHRAVRRRLRSASSACAPGPAGPSGHGPRTAAVVVARRPHAGARRWSGRPRWEQPTT